MRPNNEIASTISMKVKITGHPNTGMRATIRNTTTLNIWIFCKKYQW